MLAQGQRAESRALGETEPMTRRAGIQELQGHHSVEGEKGCAQTGNLDYQLTSNLGDVLGIHGEGSRGKVTPGLRGRGEGESVLGRERTGHGRSPHTYPG